MHELGIAQTGAEEIARPDVFDRTGAVERPSYGRLLAEFVSLLTYHPAPPDPAALPDGRGHVVLIVPAFMSNDGFTRPLREFLRRCGYRAFGWKAGRNWGPTPALREALRRRLSELCQLEGGPITVIGVSLGGIMARDLAYDRVGDIRHVITIVSPFRLPTATTIGPLLNSVARFHAPVLDRDRLATRLPVPATAIYTRDDGIVAWQSCRAESPDCVDIECDGRHTTICRNPRVMKTVAERLGQVR